MGKSYSKRQLVLLLCTCVCVTLLGYTISSHTKGQRSTRPPPKHKKRGEAPAKHQAETKPLQRAPTDLQTEEQGEEDVGEVGVCDMSERMAHIKQYCERHGRKEVDPLGYVATNFGRTVAYCPIPKCSSSSFLYLMEMANTSTKCNIRNSNIVIYPLTKCGVEKLFFNKPIPQIPFIFTIIRNPFDRIVSMYYDKVVNKDKTFDTFWTYVHRTYGKKKAGVSGETMVPFTRYVDLLLDLWLGRAAYQLTFHERFHLFPYTEFCDFCGLDYKYIARLETKEQDFPVLQEKIGKDAAVKNLNTNRKVSVSLSAVQRYQKEWTEVAASKRRALYEMFKGDFEMFGYHYNINENTIQCFFNDQNGKTCC